jgi:hypothetical protein
VRSYGQAFLISRLHLACRVDYQSPEPLMERAAVRAVMPEKADRDARHADRTVKLSDRRAAGEEVDDALGHRRDEAGARDDERHRSVIV